MANLTRVLAMAHDLLNGSFNAGGGYADVWVRDLATFAHMALDVNPARECQNILLGFFERQRLDGEIAGGYRLGSPAPDPARPFTPCLGGTPTCKNTCETDQESSLVLSVDAYVERTSDAAFLSRVVNGSSVISRLEGALSWLLAHRRDAATGLLWGGTTLDWGDVQVEAGLADERALGPRSHKAVDAYDNSMFVLAIRALLRLKKLAPPARAAASVTIDWPSVLSSTSLAVKQRLWNASRAAFVPHLYLAGSPFPRDFDESGIRCHGSIAVAALAGLLTTAEVRAAYRAMQHDVASIKSAGGDVTIGITMVPPYPTKRLPTMNLGPEFVYQNGGDWAWFGGRWVRALLQAGLVDEAAEALQPMAARVEAHGGFYEWYDFHGRPKGSSKFHGSAGELGRAITELLGALGRGRRH